MRLKLQSNLLGITAVLSLGLAACGSGDKASRETSSTAAEAAPSGEAAQASTAGLSLTDGPDVCFRTIAAQLGADTKVAEITSFFSAGSEIDNDRGEPAGEMTTCTVNYQNPADPRKLLTTRLDLSSGKFADPAPLEITVTGGNAAEFDLEDYLVPLSKIDPAALKSVMEAQKARLEGIYSKYAWTGVRLSGPDAFSNTHTLRIDIEGRLASNDIKNGGYASVTTDGKTITKDHLLP